jgi:hyperosmotically inducible protein
MKRLLWTLAASMILSLAAFAGASSRIDRSVRHELVMLPQLTVFDNLAYKVDDGTVTLYGQVRNAVLKDEAASVVKKIEGVATVNNQIEILPASFNDDRIRRQEARAIFGYESLSRYSLGVVPPIHIIVKNGHVALEGVVNNQMDKNVAGIRANGVAGVFSVENNLNVENSVTAMK